MSRKKHGDRPDGVWLRDLPAMNLIMPTVMPNRADNEAYIGLKVDLRPLDAYLAKKNEGRTEDKYTYFHVIAAAIAKAFILRPAMNRFICKNRIYQRKNVTVAFIVKKKFEDKSEEGMAFLEYTPEETLDSFHSKIMEVIHQTRREDVKDASSNAMDILVKIPHFVTVAAVKLIRWLDQFGCLPKSIIGSDPNHAAIFLSNLGSIGLECGYHHLVNWGTNSCFVVLGKKHYTVEYDKEGNGDCHEVIPLGVTLDERIADGYYYSKTVALVKELLAHPELLELPASTPVEYAVHR
ncbi:MAG TPA: 2-oxo acid dehydrogenase subunit E2 [Candidatus Faecousia intestinigallinarum]|nr:2-oxo acid dehydrogenase subunit E2 [Candidatus Faecousia intestinigallinarum]